eukprot:7206677-Prymnesium_polylepis.1
MTFADHLPQCDTALVCTASDAVGDRIYWPLDTPAQVVELRGLAGVIPDAGAGRQCELGALVVGHEALA